MRVRVRQLGGFAGTVDVEVDTARLAPEARREVEEAVHRAGERAERESAEGGDVGADLSRFEVEVRDGSAVRSFAAAAASPAGGAAALLADLVGRHGGARR
jgi:hypothetical protein